MTPHEFFDWVMAIMGAFCMLALAALICIMIYRAARG